jgi:hypothetical protein
MIGLIFKRTPSVFRTGDQRSNILIGAAFSRADARRNFTSNTLIPVAMSSVQQAAAPKRAVGKKFVIACDGESHMISRSSKSDTDIA